MDRIQKFENNRLGLFIHYGLYSMFDKGEWSFYSYESVRNEYENAFKTFNPINFNFDEIIKISKDSGFKYAVLTTRHHDGFSLYDTNGLSDYDVMHTPYKKDIVKQFVDACNKYGLKPHFYHTMQDWQHPLYEKDFERYNQYLRDSIKVLCTNYGEIGGFWFDGAWSNTEVDWKWDELYSLIRKYQPNTIITNNTGIYNRGHRGHDEIDVVTFEQGHLIKMDNEGLRPLASEACLTINNTWGSASKDINYKSIKELIENLTKCRKNDCNLLLNLAPKYNKNFTHMELGILECIGLWMDYVKEFFYDGKLSKIECKDKDFILEKDNKLYLFVHDLPELVDIIEGYSNSKVKYELSLDKVKNMYYLDNKKRIDYKYDNKKLIFDCIGFDYGTNLIVRVVVIEME